MPAQSGAKGLDGTGGTVQVDFATTYADTASAVTSADGSVGDGGSISVNGGTGGRLFSSGSFDAEGTNGGNIDLFGQNVFLVDASVDTAARVGNGGRIQSAVTSKAGTLQCRTLKRWTSRPRLNWWPMQAGWV